MLNVMFAGQNLTAATLVDAFDATMNTKYQAADPAPVNNSTVLVSSNDLVFPVVINSAYAFEVHIFFDSNTTADFKHGLLLPASSTTLHSALDNDSTASTAVTWVSQGAGSGTVVGSSRRGIIVIAGTSGNVTYQYAQNTANASNTLLKAGSWMRMAKVA